MARGDDDSDRRSQVARLIDEALRTPTPEVVVRPDLSQPLVDVAEQLIRSGVPDIDAVTALRDAAGDPAVDLVAAADLVRFHGTIEESRTDFRCFRLLLAAAADVIPPAIDAALDDFHDRIAHLESMGPAGAFSLLASTNLALKDVETKALDEIAAGHEADAIWDDLVDALERVVGPWSDVDADLARSLTALGMCRIHLATRIGIELDPA